MIDSTKRHRKLYMALMFLVYLPVQSSSAQTESISIDEQLQSLEEAIKEGRKKSSNLNKTAKKLRLELLSLKKERVRIASTIRNTERKMYRLEKEISLLEQKKMDKSALIEGKRDQFSFIVKALHRLARHPPDTIIAYPEPLTDVIRTSLILKVTLPKIEERVQQLRSELLSLEKTQLSISSRRKKLVSFGALLDTKRGKMDQKLDNKRDVRLKTLAARQVEETRLQRLGREAEDLKGLFAQLEKERIDRAKWSKTNTVRNTEPSLANSMPRRLESQSAFKTNPPFRFQPITDAKGALTQPVIGTIDKKYGSNLGSGVTNQGIYFESSAGAQVVSPFYGQIVFAGQFRGYGKLLIIEHGAGYHSLLSGMSRIQGLVGQWLLSGEPVGLMAKPTSGKPALYMEFRKNGRPVNPSPWLTKVKDRITG